MPNIIDKRDEFWRIMIANTECPFRTRGIEGNGEFGYCEYRQEHNKSEAIIYCTYKQCLKKEI